MSRLSEYLSNYRYWPEKFPPNPRYWQTDALQRNERPEDDSQSVDSDKTSSSSLTRALIFIISLVILLLIGAVIWGVFVTRQVLTVTTTTTTTTVAPTAVSTTPPRGVRLNGPLVYDTTNGEMIIEGSSRIISWTYQADLANKNSDYYKQQETAFCQVISSIFMSTILGGPGLKSCRVDEFRLSSEEGVIPSFNLAVYNAIGMTSGELRRMVMDSIHCGLVDTTSNTQFVVKVDDVFFKDPYNSNILTLHSACGGSGVCSTLVNQIYTCTCPGGYMRAVTGFNCIDVNECLANNGGCSQNCVNTPGSFTCSCNSGLSLATDGRSCTGMVDQCANSATNTCDPEREVCVRAGRSYTCLCKTGFVLAINTTTQAIACSDINECTTGRSSCSQRCENTDGSYTCTCYSGYTLMSDGHTCQDVNECDPAAPTHNCDTTAIGYDGCLDDPTGSFTCMCKPGYVQSTSSTKQPTCVDFNECTINRGGCADICINEEGGYHCDCSFGYTLNNDNRTCIDVDECVLGTHSCQDECSNTVGAYLCNCPAGYKLNTDRRTCVDTNECLNSKADCEHLCANTVGNYSCGCYHGFNLTLDGKSCEDIDECMLNNDLCSQHVGNTGRTVCVNTVGSYTCGCEKGFQEVNGICIDLDECRTTTHSCQQVCDNMSGTYRCACNPGYQLPAGGDLCVDTDECAAPVSPCSAPTNCTNTPGSYTCL